MPRLLGARRRTRWHRSGLPGPGRLPGGEQQRGFCRGDSHGERHPCLPRDSGPRCHRHFVRSVRDLGKHHCVRPSRAHHHCGYTAHPVNGTAGHYDVVHNHEHWPPIFGCARHPHDHSGCHVHAIVAWWVAHCSAGGSDRCRGHSARRHNCRPRWERLRGRRIRRAWVPRLLRARQGTRRHGPGLPGPRRLPGRDQQCPLHRRRSHAEHDPCQPWDHGAGSHGQCLGPVRHLGERFRL